MKLTLQKNMVKICFALLMLIPFLQVNAQTPVPMLSQPSTTYTENFADISAWTSNFASGIGANRWASYPITTGGTANDGKRTTKSSATFSTTTSGGVQRGTQNLVFLSTGSGTPSEAVAVDLLLDFTGTTAGTLSFNWAAVDNGNGTRPTSLRIFWSIDNTNFTEITAAQIIDVQSTNSGSITNVALPAAFNNVATARLRFYNHAGTVTGGGNRDKISVDDVTVTATPMSAPLITASGTLTSLSTVYGTASGNTQFSVSGSLMNAGITITPPVGFEVAISSDFSTTIGTNASPLVVGSAGTISATDIYVRLAANATAGNHTGPIVLSSTDASNVNVATTATNTVSQLGLTITGVTANDKNFDNTTTTTLSGTPLLVGVLTADIPNVVLGGTPIANFNDAAVGNNKPVTVTGYTISGSASGNYSLSQPTGLTANILPSGLQDQTITFNPLAAVTYGTAPFNLTATSDSGLTVTYTSSDVNIATISGNTLTVTGAGTVTITAQQAGNGSYNPAIDVPQTLLVNPKTITIIGATAQDKTYDGTTAATLTGSLSGVISPDVVTLNLSGNFDDANVGTNKPVTSTSSISGADASNYVLQQPSGLTASINLAVCGVASTGSVIWNFATAAPLSNTSVAATVSNIAYGNNNGTTTSLISTTSASTGYPGATGTQNASAASLTGALDTATSTYFEFTLTPVAGYNYTLTGMSFGSRSTSTGPQAYTLRSNQDNYTSNIATGTLLNNSVWALNTPAVTSTTSANQPVVFRLYGHNGTGTPALNTANWRIDDLILNVSATPTSALSSPATATACSGETFSYTATTNYTGATITWTRAAVAGISNAAVTTPQATNPSEILVNTTNAPIDVVYQFTITTATCYLTQDVTVTVNNCVSSSIVNLKLFIQGYYMGAGAMTTVADNQAGIAPAVSNDVEMITVELHEADSPYSMVATTTAMLHTDGTVTCEYPTAPNGSYYIAVKTRNATQTWSALPQTVGATPLTYDFTTAANQAYADNMVDLGDGSFGFFSGDISVAGIQDDLIDGADYSTWEADNNDFAFGVFATDLNGDGIVDSADYSIWEANNNNFIFASYPVAN